MERNNTQHAESLRTKLFASSAGLSLDELDSVVGGKKENKKDTVYLKCPYCGEKGDHEKISGFEAKCKKCKKIINLKAM